MHALLLIGTWFMTKVAGTEVQWEGDGFLKNRWSQLYAVLNGLRWLFHATHKSLVDVGCRTKLESEKMRLLESNIIKNLHQLGLGKKFLRSFNNTGLLRLVNWATLNLNNFV